jgi:trans-aconitate methyltransferase
MSSFSADWLALREPADHRARDPQLAQILAHFLSPRTNIKLVDLGCGTGSNLRALAPDLSPISQHWTLIDHDPKLLETARKQIDAWRELTPVTVIECRFESADLQADIEKVITDDCDVVTAAAFFDLVSESWLDRFVELLAERRPALYTTLIYDGAMRWQPEHPADKAIESAFNSHQLSDKGFGRAAGPDAGDYLVKQLELRAGYHVEIMPSPWKLGTNELPLILATAEGVAQAARETGELADAEIRSWLDVRPNLQSCEIGHFDLLALPQ